MPLVSPHTQNNTGGIETGPILVEHLLVNMHHEIATVGILHHKADMLGRLKASEQVDQERMLPTVDDLEDALLRHQALDLLAVKNVALLQRLDRIELTAAPVLRQNHLFFFSDISHNRMESI